VVIAGIRLFARTSKWTKKLNLSIK
jgi:hypothetical protein